MKVVLLQTTFVLQPSLASHVFVNLYLDIALKEQFDILWTMLIHFLAESLMRHDNDIEWYHSHVYTYNMKLQLEDCELNLAQHKDWKEWETASMPGIKWRPNKVIVPGQEIVIKHNPLSQ